MENPNIPAGSVAGEPAAPVLSQPELDEVKKTAPAGMNPAPVKAKKALNRLLYVADAELMLFHASDGTALRGFSLVAGSEEGFRTKEELRKFAKALPPGRYRKVTAETQTIEVFDRRQIKGV